MGKATLPSSIATDSVSSTTTSYCSGSGDSEKPAATGLCQLYRTNWEKRRQHTGVVEALDGARDGPARGAELARRAHDRAYRRIGQVDRQDRERHQVHCVQRSAENTIQKDRVQSNL
jgi:hypothetical protein